MLLASALGLAALGSARADERPAARRAALESELGRLEQIARVATTTEAAYRAECEGARIAFDLAETPEGGTSGELAQRGLELADRARQLVPDRAEAHYRYALCLGLYLREHPLSGIRRAKELVISGERAAQLDERFDRGGPHRFLAILYSEAPRFVGPGDHDKAREHVARLLALDPDDEDNKLAAARVWINLGEKDRAHEVLARVHPERADSAEGRETLRSERARLQKKLDDD